MVVPEKDSNLTETLKRDSFVNSILVGSCPKCGSDNVHDCEAKSPIREKNVITERYFQYGSNCPIAKKLDNIGLGHCDDCNYLWCLDCGSEVSIEDSNCGHWEFCNNCKKIDQDSECPECPYAGCESDCPEIASWKEKKAKE